MGTMPGCLASGLTRFQTSSLAFATAAENVDCHLDKFREMMTWEFDANSRELLAGIGRQVVIMNPAQLENSPPGGVNLAPVLAVDLR